MGLCHPRGQQRPALVRAIHQRSGPDPHGHSGERPESGVPQAGDEGIRRRPRRGVRGWYVVGLTGVGKSWIACALGQKACRDGRSVIYHRVPRLFEALALAHGDGRYGRLLKTLARVQLLILDDWGLSAPTEPEQRDLLEILEDRHQRASTIVTSQVPVEQWCDIIGNPTRADAILDRLVHNAHRLPMTGESMRKLSAKKRVLDDAATA